jgi:hypothetical protein
MTISLNEVHGSNCVRDDEGLPSRTTHSERLPLWLYIYLFNFHTPQLTFRPASEYRLIRNAEPPMWYLDIYCVTLVSETQHAVLPQLGYRKISERQKI